MAYFQNAIICQSRLVRAGSTILWTGRFLDILRLRAGRQFDNQWLLLPCHIGFLTIPVRPCLFAELHVKIPDHSSNNQTGF